MSEGVHLGDAAGAAKKKGSMVTVTGVLTMLLGVLAMSMPFLAGGAVTMMIAVTLIIAGAARIVFAFGAESWGKGTLAFLFGALTVAAGVWVMTRPLLAMLSLTTLLMVYFLIDGVLEIFAALKIKPHKAWTWMLFSGVITLILGVMLMMSMPAAALWLIGVLVGVRLLFAGMSMTVFGSTVRSVASDVQDAFDG